MQQLNHIQLQLIAHSIGIDLLKAVISNKKKDKALPAEFYRNRFNAGPTHSDMDTIKSLISIGAMSGFPQSPDFYYVTKAGISQFKKQFAELAVYKRPAERDKAYISHQINFYCQFYNYCFSDNNAESVFGDFQKYFWQKYYMSHTMTDVVNKFKTDLKRLFPKKVVLELTH